MTTLALSRRCTAAIVAYGGQTAIQADFPALPIGGPYTGLFVRRVRAGVVTVLDLDAFSVTAASDGGFTAVLDVGATAGDILQVYGDGPTMRDIALTPGGAIATDVLEADAVHVQAQLQEHRRDIDAAIAAPLGETPAFLPAAADRADGYMTFDSAGNPAVTFPQTIPSIGAPACRRVFTSGTAAVLVTDQVLFVEVGAAVTVALPDPATFPNRELTVADALGVAGVDPITLAPAAGLINGAADYVLATPYAAVTVISNGVKWIVVSLC